VYNEKFSHLSSRGKQKGIALFQVLLISAVISILAIQFTQTAKNQISIATALANRTTASLISKSAESELLFSLLTQTKAKTLSADNEIVRKWNFHGKPFNVKSNIEYKIQDLSSLVGLFDNQNVSTLTAAFNLIGIPQAQTFAENLVKWQSNKVPLQNYQELDYINGLSPKNWQDIKPFITIRPQSYINPMLAPKELLALDLPAPVIDTIIGLRNKGELTALIFRQLSGLSNDVGMFFFVSGLLRISIKVTVNNVQFKQNIEVLVRPYKNYPVIEYERTN